MEQPSILDRKDADEAIRALSELEAYYIVKELGREGAGPVLALLESHQLRALVDLDTWHEDRVSLDDLLLWLEALREAGTEALSRAAHALDPELLALLFRRRLLIALAPRDGDASDSDHPVPDWLEDPPDAILPLVQTADRRFVIAARAMDETEEDARELDEESRKLILELVDALYKDDDLELVVGALRAAHDDLSSVLEEGALQYRTSRLEDLGFPELNRALELYAPLAPEQVFGERPKRLPIPDLVLPALHAGRLSAGLFREVLESVESVEVIRRIEGELVALANAAAVADRVEPGDLSHLGEVLERVRAYIELGLAADLEGEDLVDLARARIEEQPLRALFRVGFGLTLALGQRATRLVRGGAFRVGDQPLGLLDDASAAVLRALDTRRPRFPRVLEGEPAEATRPFAGREDLARVDAALRELEELAEVSERLALARGSEALAGDLDPPLASERDLDMLLATAAANALLGRGFVLEALAAADLRLIAGRLFGPVTDAAALEAALTAYTERTGAPARAALRARVRAGLDALRETLSALPAQGALDARFVGVVVRDLR